MLSITPTKQPIIPSVRRETLLKMLSKGERIDGRKPEEYRRISVLLNPIPRSEGSALVKIGNTIVMTGVKLEIGAPFPDRPNEGVLQVHAEFVPLASPTFEPGPPDEVAIETARVIDRSLREPRVVKLEDLAIYPGKKVWLIYNDLYLLDHDGNIIDTGMLSTILALNMTRIPRIVVENEERITIDRFNKEKPLPINLNVVTVTIGVFNDLLLVDPCLDEELVLDSQITFAIDDRGRITGLQRIGMKGIHTKTLDNAVELALKKASELHDYVRKVLNNPNDFIKSSLSLEEL